ncbi:MAG: hypothetical protein Fur0039_17840 [Rhodocyclaceae bacterium]
MLARAGDFFDVREPCGRHPACVEREHRLGHRKHQHEYYTTDRGLRHRFSLAHILRVGRRDPAAKPRRTRGNFDRLPGDWFIPDRDIFAVFLTYISVCRNRHSSRDPELDPHPAQPQGVADHRERGQAHRGGSEDR